MFKIHRAVHPYFITPWHFHPEHEILLIEESKGMRFVGDHVESFTNGDLVFVGKNLPHYWRNDNEYYQKNSSLLASALVVQFSDYFWENALCMLPEGKLLQKLFDNAQKGIKFTGRTKSQITKKFKRLESHTGFERFLAFSSLLYDMAMTDEYILLSSDVFIENYSCRSNKRLNKVFTYIMENFTEQIRLKDVAALINMSETNFCRYFKKRTHKSFTSYLNRIRIGYACKLLMEGELNITQICYESGFNNISNFNEQFKKHTNQTPRSYSKHHKKGLPE